TGIVLLFITLTLVSAAEASMAAVFTLEVFTVAAVTAEQRTGSRGAARGAESPNVCPTTLTNLLGVFRVLPPADRDPVRIAFISVDPQRDTPAQLKNYLSYFDLAFVGLTGSKDEIDRTTGAFDASYAFVHKPDDPPDNYNVMHSANVYLVNPKGEWEMIYE